MKVIQTPDECFENLSDYPFAPSYPEIPNFENGSLRTLSVDKTSKHAHPVGFIGGNPAWSYLWRKNFAVARGRTSGPCRRSHRPRTLRQAHADESLHDGPPC